MAEDKYIVTNPRGAFEMDLEFYTRNLFGTQEKKSSKLKTLRVYKSPRILSKSATESIFHLAVEEISKRSKISRNEILQKTFDLIASNLSRFKVFLPIKTESLSDQYYFDISLFCLYSVSASIITDSTNRVALRYAIGDSIFSTLVVKALPELNSRAQSNVKADLSSLIPSICSKITNILQYFTSIGLISGFIFDEEDASDVLFAKESFSQKLPISFQFTLKEPATIISFIELAGQNTLFHPEVIASTIASFIRSLDFIVSFDDYLLDNYYREENFDVQAQDVIIEMSLKPNLSLNFNLN